MFWRFFSVTGCIRTSFWLENSIALYRHTGFTYAFTSLWVFELLPPFCCCRQCFCERLHGVWMDVSSLPLVRYLEVKWLGLWWSYNFSFSTFSPTLTIISLTYCCHYSGCKGASHCCFDLHFHSNWVSPVAQLVKNPPTMWETWVWSLGWEDSLEKGKVTHSSILAWRIPWTTVHRVAKSRTRLSDFHFTYFIVANDIEFFFMLFVVVVQLLSCV